MHSNQLHQHPSHLDDGYVRQLYKELLSNGCAKGTAHGWLTDQLALTADIEVGLPDHPHDLYDWMKQQHEQVERAYVHYLTGRKGGQPRLYFTNRSHALAFLRRVAPTKLVDGSWLYGLVKHWQNPRLMNLLRTYLEELGDGRADRNHVLLYRRLLDSQGITNWDDLPDGYFVQGAIQLALAANVEDMLPEVIGFNLGYEQLPLHLLVTAYELNELGIDPYYFTLHVTVDNADSGHAKRAVDAVLDLMPAIGASQEYWERVRRGFALNDLGISTNQVIREFDMGVDVVQTLARKSRVGRAAHSDYCKIEGRKVNEWLSHPTDIPEFLAAMIRTGWIVPNAPPEDSRFWRLLDGDHAEMFGVFTASELQLLQDWIRGSASADGAPVPEPGQALRPPRSFRAQTRIKQMEQTSSERKCDGEPLDPDAAALHASRVMNLEGSQVMMLLSPAQHWTPAGLIATRDLCSKLNSGCVS